MDIKDWAQSLTGRHLVILDIDSTLVTTYQRNQGILEAFCHRHKEDYPVDIAQLLKVQCLAGDYGLTTGLERSKVAFTSDQVRQSLFQFWRTHFFSNDFLHRDQPMTGAIEFANKLHNSGIPLMYLTARAHAPMIEGTIQSLQTLGFPMGPSLPLILKKEGSVADEDYKSAEIKKIKEKFEEITLIDNEPVVLQKINRDHPEVQLIWMDSTHSGRAKAPDNATVITDFNGIF